MPGRYSFYTIFSYNPDTGTIVPRFNVYINGVYFSLGSQITRWSNKSGLNLFNYIGKDIAGDWNRENRILTIRGFY